MVYFLLITAMQFKKIKQGKVSMSDYNNKIEVHMELECLSLAEAGREFEKKYIARVMEINKGKKGKTAGMLGVDRKTLYRKLRQHEA